MVVAMKISWEAPKTNSAQKRSILPQKLRACQGTGSRIVSFILQERFCGHDL
jgi:hypothetical protein